MESIQLTGKCIYAAITVDGDLRLGNRQQQKAGVQAMREVHAQLGIQGRTTWFINEYDFRWTENHQDLLINLWKSGEALGIHDHFDTHYAETYPQVRQMVLESKTRLAGFFNQVGRHEEITIHRNGCALQSSTAYAALLNLGYQILSDVWPEMIWRSREIAVPHPVMPWRYLSGEDEDTIPMDNSRIPLTASPWRHDVDNWLDYRCQDGAFLQVPITTMPWIDRDRMLKAAVGPNPTGWVTLDTHPYDLQDPATAEVDPERVARYQKDLEWLKTTLDVEFIRLDQVPGILDRRTPDQTV